MIYALCVTRDEFSDSVSTEIENQSLYEDLHEGIETLGFLDEELTKRLDAPLYFNSGFFKELATLASTEEFSGVMDKQDYYSEKLRKKSKVSIEFNHLQDNEIGMQKIMKNTKERRLKSILLKAQMFERKEEFPDKALDYLVDEIHELLVKQNFKLIDVFLDHTSELTNVLSLNILLTVLTISKKGSGELKRRNGLLNAVAIKLNKTGYSEDKIKSILSGLS
jgi:hypothetical protein